MSKTSLKAAAILLVVGVVVGAPQAAHAGFQLSWSASTAVLGSDPTDNSLSTGGTVTSGIFKINASAGGSALIGAGIMDLSSITVSSTGAGTLTLYLSQNGQTAPLGAGTLSETLTGSFVTGGGSVSLVSYANDSPNNLIYGNATGQGGTSIPSSPTPGNAATAAITFGGSASTSFTATNPYSETEVLTITFSGAGSTTLSTDSSTTFAANPANPAVPEPASLALLAAGIPVLGLVWNRRRKAKVA